MHDTEEFQYAGFWARFGAQVIDTILIAAVTVPLLHFFYGPYYWYMEGLVAGPTDFFLSWIVPAGAVILFWKYRQATPGKMVISARVVDAQTGLPPSTPQCIGRYLGYFVSALMLGLGFIWIAFDSRKQGWHDKLAGTVVIKKRIVPDKVGFPESSA